MILRDHTKIYIIRFFAISGIECSHIIQQKDIYYVELMINNIKDIQLSLLEQINSKSTGKCRYRVGNSLCFSDTRNVTYFGGMIFINFSVPKTNKTTISCNLIDIPYRIQLNCVQYLLRGAIAYISIENAVGHFIAYCRRHNGKWESYNDLNVKKTPCAVTNILGLSSVLYSV